MSGSSSSSSSSSCGAMPVTVSPRPQTKYEVFLSFRGADTRDGFTSHLYEALRWSQIDTFKDDDGLARGDEISRALEHAIEDSVIYVIIFSQHYASSAWCLNELTKILECKEKFSRDVIPVFYKVDPSIVRYQKESYAEAFVKHEQRYKDKVAGWKAGLAQAAGFSGWDSRVIRSEAELVKDIVKHILRKLDSFSISHPEGLIGIDKHVEQIKPMLLVESASVRIIGIWGMGGSGKTTIAHAICRELATQFSSSSFVDVQDQIEREGGVHHIREKYLSELLEEKHGGYRQRVERVKVLLILDNVNNACQLEDLIGGRRSFGSGSRIIVTSRDKQVLSNVADEIYEVKEMSYKDSLQLFSLNAFKQNYPTATFMDLTEKVLNYAKGIPLALRVLGSLLYGKTEEEWESKLQNLEKLPDPETFNVLKLSYDALDEEQKAMFLDIACFYNGHEMNIVKRTFDDCGFSAAIGIKVLIDRCLISTLNRKIVMHDLIQDMGQEIVRQECVNDPGKRSRLWKHGDTYQLLKKNKGTDAIQCIFLDLCKIREVHLHAKTFKMMHNLRLLQFYKSHSNKHSKVYINEFLESLPDELKFLRWDGFPQRSLPLDFWPENLVEFDMRNSHLEQLWDGDQDLPNLKRLNLSGSRKLIQIPDLSRSPNIEEVILSHCVKLDVVLSSSFLSKLNYLWLNGCDGLRILNLPSSILSRSSGLIVLYNCRSLEKFSVGVLSFSCSRYGLVSSRGTEKKEEGRILDHALVSSRGSEKKEEVRILEEYFPSTFEPFASAEIYEPANNINSLNLKVLREGSPSSFPSINELCWLDLSNCESLTGLPVDLCQMKFLRRLFLGGCSNLKSFPEINQTMENLTVIILDKTAIQELPSSFGHLVGLEELSLHRCQRLELIPSSIGNLCRLCKLDLTYCESLETLPSSIFKLKLAKLDLHGCSVLRTLPELTVPIESTGHLWLTRTAIKELPPTLDYLIGLQTLRLKFCTDLEFLPSSIVNLNLLHDLDCSGCAKLTEIPNDIGLLSSLRELSLQGSGIVNLPDSIAHLLSLKSLDLSDCKMLECIPELPTSLKQLLAFDCPAIRRVSKNQISQDAGPKEAIFKLHFTNSQELDPSAHSNIEADARHKLLQDAYRSVFFCFPGSTVPSWFPYQCKGHSVTLDAGSLDWCNDERFIGFALCVVLASPKKERDLHSICYRFTFDSDDGLHVVPIQDQQGYCFNWKGQERFMFQNHTLVWKFRLESTSINYMLSHAHNFTFEVLERIGYRRSYYVPASMVHECGICPLYAKEKDDNSRSEHCWVHYIDRPGDV